MSSEQHAYIYIDTYRTDQQGTDTQNGHRNWHFTAVGGDGGHLAVRLQCAARERACARGAGTKLELDSDGVGDTVARTSTCTPTSLRRSVSVPASDFVTAAQCLEVVHLCAHEVGNSDHEREGGALQQGDSGVDDVRPRKQRAGDQDDTSHPC